MSRFTLTTRVGAIAQLETNDIRVIQDDSILSWNNKSKQPGMQLLNKGSTVRLQTSRSGYKGILSKTSMVINTDTFNWSLTINQNCVIRAGLALSTRDLTSDDNSDVVFEQFTATKGDRIIFLLGLDTCIVELSDENIILDTSQYIGQRMYPWLSAVPGSGMSVTIKNYQTVNIKIDELENAQVDTLTSTGSSTAPLLINAGEEGIKFGAGVSLIDLADTSIVVDPDEHVSITSSSSERGFTVYDDSTVKIDTVLQSDTVETTLGSTQLEITGGGGNSAIINSDGNLVINPGEMATTHIQAPSGGSIKLVHDGGSGINVSSGGDVTFDATPLFGAIRSQSGNNLTLNEGTSDLGITIANNTGAVTTTGSGIKTNIIKSNMPSVHRYGPLTATKVEISSSAVDTEVKGNLDVKNIDVTGNITVTGTIDGVDLITGTTGTINAHSDININNPVDNEVLQYNNNSNAWVNSEILTDVGSHTHAVSAISDVTNFSDAMDARITLQKNNNNGLATLDGGRTIPLTQIHISNLEYKGTWNANTNSPSLSSGTGTEGYYYAVSVTGSTNLDGITDWQIGDWAIYNGTAWEKTNNPNTDNTHTITSVAGYIGDVVLGGTDLTDVTDTGSGAIITSGERTQIGINNTNNTGTITTHSDMTNAGSGAIITSGERTALSTVSATYVPLSGGTMTGDIDMDSNDITSVNNINIGNDLNTSTLTTTISGVLESDMEADTSIINSIGVNAVTISPGTSSSARAYDVQNQGTTGVVLVIPVNNIGLVNDAVVSASAAPYLTLNSANKTAGTGDGGNLILRGGTSAGGTDGYVKSDGKIHFVPQTEPTGESGSIYYDSGTNKLRVYNGTSWIDLH